MSSDGKVEVEFTSRMAQLLRDYDALYKAQMKSITTQGQMVTESKKAGNAQTELTRLAEKYYREAETGEERVKRKMHELNVLRKQGLIDTETQRRLVQQLGDSGRMTFDQMVRGAGQAALGMAGLGSAAAAALKVVQLVRDEWDTSQKQIRDAADFQGGLIGARRSFSRNFAGPGMSPQQGVAQIQAISRKYGADELGVTQAAGAVASARGRFSKEDALKQLAATVQLDPSLPGQELSDISGAGLDIRKAFGVTSEQSLGLLMAGQQTARVENIGQYAKNIVPGVLGLANSVYGLNPQEAFGLTSAFTQITGDKSGQQARTGTLQFAKQIVEATNQVPGMKGKSFSERLNYLLQDPQGKAIAGRMKGKLGGELDTKRRGLKVGEELTGEAVTLPAMIGILTEGSKEQAEFKAAMAGTPSAAGAEAYYRGQLSQDAAINPTARVREQTTAMLQTLKGDTARGIEGESTRAFYDILDQTKLPFGDRAIMKADFAIGTLWGNSPSSQAMHIFQDEANVDLKDRAGYEESAKIMLEAAQMMRDNIQRIKESQPNGPRPQLQGAVP